MRVIPFKDDPVDRLLGLGEQPGYFGVFTRHQYAGAEFPNGTRVVKVKSADEDHTPEGTKGTVLGSIGHPDLGSTAMYFIEWDNQPRFGIGCMSSKLRKE